MVGCDSAREQFPEGVLVEVDGQTGTVAAADDTVGARLEVAA